MSYQNFKKATKLAKKCEDYDDGGGKADAVISKAEELLGIKFSRQVNEYLKEFGWIEFFGVELFGITKDDFSGKVLEGNCVEWALSEREKYKLPKNWLPIYNFDDGYMGFLDFDNLNEEGEPSVIMAIYNGTEYVVTEKVANDLGDFILGLVEEQLKEQ